MFTALRHSLRLFTIAYTLARHGAVFSLEAVELPPFLLKICRLIARSDAPERKGQRLAAALQALGPTFVKMGQALSTRSDLMGDDIAKDLAELQDKLPPFPASEAKRIIEAALEKPLHEIYTQFEDAPVAAASIAQVHFAETKGGEKVAVKVLRPGIEQQFARDISLFYWIARIVERRLPHWRRLKPIEVVHTFEKTIRFELDLRYEAAAAVELKQNTQNDPGFYVPAIDWGRTGQHVLTMERIDGTPVSDVEALKKRKVDLPHIVQTAASSFFYQVFRDGFFHADMHPGNLFVMKDGRLAVVDFGIMGRIDVRTRWFLAQILHGFLTEDYENLAKVHVEAGYVPNNDLAAHFGQACMAIAKPILGKPLNEISIAKLLGLLFRNAETFEMEMQPQLLLLQKTMMLAEGVGRMLAPQVNMWKTAEPLIREWAKEHMNTKERVKLVAEELRDTAMRLPQLVRDTENLVAQLRASGLSVDEESLRQFSRAGRQNQSPWLRFAWASLGLLTAILLVLAANH